MGPYTVRKNHGLEYEIVNKLGYRHHYSHIADQRHNHIHQILIHMRGSAHYNNYEEAEPWPDIRYDIQYPDYQSHHQGLIELYTHNGHSQGYQYHYTCTLNKNTDKIPCQQLFNGIQRPGHILNIRIGYPHKDGFKKKMLILKEKESYKGDRENSYSKVPQYIKQRTKEVLDHMDVKYLTYLVRDIILYRKLIRDILVEDSQ